MKIIEVHGLFKSFHGKTVLEDISFDINPGTFTALLGKNGSGKSTILNILMGEVQMDKGEVKLFGESLRKNPDHLKAKIGHVSEKIRFDYPLTIDEFIKGYGTFFPNYDETVVRKLAKDVGIDLKKFFGEYSRGQKMQIALLAAMGQNPELLLIDEITSVLDAYARTFFTELLKNYTKQGGTVILTTNIVNEVQYYCTDVIFLSKNKIKFQTALADIPANFRKVRSTNPEHPVLKDPDCIWSGINSDGSSSYILPNGSISKGSLEGLMEDKRAVTLEDLYIYHSQRDRDE